MANEEAGVPQTLIGIDFPDAFRAQEFLTAVTRLAANGQLKLRDAVFVSKDEHGRTIAKETADLQTGPTALSGALWAGLFGLLLGGPVGWLAGAAVGAGAGAITAKVVDLGISDEWVDWFREAVEPGSTILALLAEEVDRQALADELERFHSARLVYANLDDAWTARLRDALGEEQAAGAAASPASPGGSGPAPTSGQTDSASGQGTA
jgi:uncharacterized membrane protein